jgi:hypothetical protein
MRWGASIRSYVTKCIGANFSFPDTRFAAPESCYIGGHAAKTSIAEKAMHHHGREILEVVVVAVIAIVAAVWFFIGRESANKPPDSH